MYTIERLDGEQWVGLNSVGGLVPGSLVLIGGDPGIGKSTLILQSATAMAHQRSVLYVAAEESAQQVKLRWNRIEDSESNLHLLAETDLELVIKELNYLKPDVAVIDSIQALHDQNLSSSPGSVAQVRVLVVYGSQSLLNNI